MKRDEIDVVVMKKNYPRKGHIEKLIEIFERFKIKLNKTLSFSKDGLRQGVRSLLSFGTDYRCTEISIPLGEVE